jgi:hypothetical protein
MESAGNINLRLKTVPPETISNPKSPEISIRIGG